MWLGSGVYRAWKTSFDMATLLKTIILPSRVRFWNLKFCTVCTLEPTLGKMDSSFIVLLYEK